MVMMQPLVPARSPDMKPKRYSVAGQEGQAYMKRADGSGEGGFYPGFHFLVYRRAPCFPNLSLPGRMTGQTTSCTSQPGGVARASTIQGRRPGQHSSDAFLGVIDKPATSSRDRLSRWGEEGGMELCFVVNKDWTNS